MTAQRPSIPARIHIVGIGGNGMSAVAEYLVSLQRQVSGSDLQKSPELEHLASLGVQVFAEHDAGNVGTAQMAVMSDAIPAQNPELIEARQRGLRVLRRAECFALLGADKAQICVAGSHGKTTTTAMIAHVLNRLERIRASLWARVFPAWEIAAHNTATVRITWRKHARRFRT
jgi:UDP-N-acetylmuramate--alanine ligase